MADANLRAADPRNYQLPGRVSVWFRKAGATQEADWVEFGNIVDPSIAATIERLEHFSQRRGARAKDRSLVSERSAQLNFTIDEINQRNLQFAFGSSSDGLAADSIPVNEQKTFSNPGAGNTIALGDTDIQNVIVREIELEGTPITFDDPDDYTVDLSTGILTVSGTGALASGGAPAEIQVFYQKLVDTESFEIFDGTSVEGEVRLQIITPVGIKWCAQFNNVNIINNGDIGIGDGTAFSTIALTVDILTDDNGELGTLHVIKDGEI